MSLFLTSTLDRSREKAVSNGKLTVSIDLAFPNVAALAQNFTNDSVAIGLKV